jgi:P27 family predicted phage terminase small subunit
MTKPPAKLPKAPKQLSKEAKGWWRHFVEGWELDKPALLVLESALECFDRMRAAQALITEEGMVTTDRFGQQKAHPAVLVERDAKGNMLRHLKQLGLDLEPLRPGPGRPPGS